MNRAILTDRAVDKTTVNVSVPIDVLANVMVKYAVIAGSQSASKTVRAALEDVTKDVILTKEMESRVEEMTKAGLERRIRRRREFNEKMGIVPDGHRGKTADAAKDFGLMEETGKNMQQGERKKMERFKQGDDMGQMGKEERDIGAKEASTRDSSAQQKKAGHKTVLLKFHRTTKNPMESPIPFLIDIDRIYSVEKNPTTKCAMLNIGYLAKEENRPCDKFFLAEKFSEAVDILSKYEEMCVFHTQRPGENGAIVPIAMKRKNILSIETSTYTGETMLVTVNAVHNKSNKVICESLEEAAKIYSEGRCKTGEELRNERLKREALGQ